MGSTVAGRFRLTGRLRQNKSFAAVTRAAMLERPVSKVQRSSNLHPPPKTGSGLGGPSAAEPDRQHPVLCSRPSSDREHQQIADSKHSVE